MVLETQRPFTVTCPTLDEMEGGTPRQLGFPKANGKEPSCEVEVPFAIAAVKVQKVYKSYRTRRLLADSAVVAEEFWWQVLDYARLSRSTISFFNYLEPESVASKLKRVGLNASKVGRGLSIYGQALKLAFQHWIEAIDPRHRYGHNLHLYFDEWSKADSGQPFFYWLDVGDGKEVNLPECPRSKLQQQCIKYLGPQEREHYEYIVLDGKITHKQTGNLLDTTKGMRGANCIFVMSTSKRLYAGEKKKGMFHHSSFLAGGATLAAGRLEADNGHLKSISPYSGHYRPTQDNFKSFLCLLKDNGVNLDEVEIKKASECPAKLETPTAKKNATPEPPENAEPATKREYKRTLSGGLQSPRTEVSKTAILQRISSKKAAKSYQLGHQISFEWSTGAGPRIGCVADYPPELRTRALEFVNLSPRTPPTPPT